MLPYASTALVGNAFVEGPRPWTFDSRARPLRLAISPEEKLKNRLREEVREFVEAQQVAPASPAVAPALSTLDLVLLPVAAAVGGRALLLQRKPTAAPIQRKPTAAPIQRKPTAAPKAEPTPQPAAQPAAPALGGRRTAILSLCTGALGLVAGRLLAPSEPTGVQSLPGTEASPTQRSGLAVSEADATERTLRAQALVSSQRITELEARLEVQTKAGDGSRARERGPAPDAAAPAPAPASGSASWLNAPLGALAAGEAATLAVVVPALCKARNTSLAIGAPERARLESALGQRERELAAAAAEAETRRQEAAAAERALEQARAAAAITEASVRQEAERRVAEAKAASSR
eukprot:scaffold6068_cov119-Isochrysis_galbana.AAC.28